MTKEEAIDAIRDAFGNTEYTDELIKTLEQESVLDEIIAEIEAKKEDRCFDDDDMYIYKTGLNDAIDIVNKFKDNLKNIEAQNPVTKTFEHESILDKPHIVGDYMQGYKNGLRTAEWRYNNAVKEIREHADRLKDSLYGDGLRHALEIIDEHKAEGVDRANLNDIEAQATEFPAEKSEYAERDEL